MTRLAEPTATIRPVLATCLLIVVCVGCSATGQVSQSSLSDLRKGIADTSALARLSMTEANQLARERAISRVLSLNRPRLAEKDFTRAVSSADIAKWDHAFVQLDEYVTALQFLTSPDRTTETENAAVNLSKQLANSSPQLAVSPKIASAFTQLGKMLISSRANRDALAIMRQTDGALREVLNGLAQAVYDPTQGSGLRVTVWSNWTDAIDGNDPATPQSRWVNAIDSKASQATKRKIIDDFLQMIDSRDAQIAALDRLRQSLGLLADAYSSAAQGSSRDAESTIAFINAQLVETEAVYKRFRVAQAATRPQEKP